MKVFLFLAACAVGLFFVAVMVGDRNDLAYRASASPLRDMENCVVKGVAYYKEIGSYPTLLDGSSAGTAAREKCKRSLAAFN